MSVSCHFRTHAPQQLRLFDHLVCYSKHTCRNRKAERVVCLGIDDQLEFDRLLDRKISGLFALQNFCYVNRHATVHRREVRPVTHKPARLDELTPEIEATQTIFGCEFDNSLALSEQHWISKHEQRIDRRRRRSRKYSAQLVGTGCVPGRDLESHSVSRPLDEL